MQLESQNPGGSSRARVVSYFGDHLAVDFVRQIIPLSGDGELVPFTILENGPHNHALLVAREIAAGTVSPAVNQVTSVAGENFELIAADVPFPEIAGAIINAAVAGRKTHRQAQLEILGSTPAPDQATRLRRFLLSWHFSGNAAVLN